MADAPHPAPAGAWLRAYLAASRLFGLHAETHLRRRLQRGKEDPARWREKLGEPSLPRPTGQLVWLHAVGLGEVMALRGLITNLGQMRPDLSFLVTSSALSSARAFAGNVPPRSLHQFLPLDAPGPVTRFLDHWRPDLSIWAEQDLWPRLVVESHRRGVPLALINARMNARAYQARRRARGMFADLYARFSHISAQDPATARHLEHLGARAPVAVTGSLKASAGPLGDLTQARVDLEPALAGRKPWLAASSHADDEAIALAAHARLFAKDTAQLLIIAPRDPARRDDIAAACAVAGLDVAIRSRGDRPEPRHAVYLADGFGEMGLWYRLCPVALIGGGFAAIGGHNPWEAAHLDCAVLHGPDVANFDADYAALHAEGAATAIRDAGALAQALQNAELPAQAARARALATKSLTGMAPLCTTLLGLLPEAPHG